jgi:hypothetical protein
MSEQGPPLGGTDAISVSLAGSGPAIVGHVQDLMSSATGQLAGGVSQDGMGTVGVYGTSADGVAVFGYSQGHDGVQGRTTHPGHAGVSATNEGGGIGVYGQGTPAGYFAGDVRVTGDLSVAGDVYLLNKDIAERFACSSVAACSPGTLVSIGDDQQVVPSASPYDPRLIGVVAGEDRAHPAITLGGDDPARSVRVALLGTVDCCAVVEPGAEPIVPGDLLTSSRLPGHAMRAADQDRRIGAVIGKALTGLAAGRGTVRLLVRLQ